MDAPKRKYQKHKTESKISAKHYLNTNLKGKIIGDKHFYPLYVRVSLKDKSNYLKSRLGEYVTKEDFEQFQISRKNDLLEEANLIISTTEYLIKVHGNDFSLSLLREYNDDLITIIFRCIKDELLSTLILSDPENSSKDESPLSVLMLSFDSPYKFIINWDGCSVDELVKGLPLMFKSNISLRLFCDKFNNELPIWQLYSAICKAYFPKDSVTINDWKNGYFQERTKEMYRDSSHKNIVAVTLEIIDSLLKKYKYL